MLVDAEPAETAAATNSPTPQAPKEVENLQSTRTKRESTERRRRQSGNQKMRGEKRDVGVSNQSLLDPHSVAFLMPLLSLCLSIGAHASPCSRTSLSRLQRHFSLALFSPSLLLTPCAPPAHARICIASLLDLLSPALLCTNGADLPHLVRTRPTYARAPLHALTIPARACTTIPCRLSSHLSSPCPSTQRCRKGTLIAVKVTVAVDRY